MKLEFVDVFSNEELVEQAAKRKLYELHGFAPTASTLGREMCDGLLVGSRFLGEYRVGEGEVCLVVFTTGIVARVGNQAEMIRYPEILKIHYPDKSDFAGQPLRLGLADGRVASIAVKTSDKYSDAFQIGLFLRQARAAFRR